MSAFELTMLVPPELRYAETLRLLAVHGARQAGADEGQAEAFAADVEHAAHRFATGHHGLAIAAVFSGRTGAVEAVLTCGDTVRIARALAVGA